MLTLIVGSDWIANRDELMRQVAADVFAQRDKRILMVPELISHDTERRLAEVAGDTSSRFAQVLSFSRLGRRIAELVGHGAISCLDNSGRIVAMAAAARQLHSKLKAYASVETKPEFLMQVLDMVDELKRCCIAPGDLMIASKSFEGDFAQRLEELALLLEAYDALCSRGKRDPRDQMTWALEQLEEMDFARQHVFYVDGFPDFTRQNMAIVEHLILNSPHVTMSFTCDREGSTEPAFEKAGQTAHEILQFAKSAGVPVRILRVQPREDDLSYLRQKLFQGKIQYQPQLQPRCKALRAKSVYEECEAAAQEVLHLVHSGGRYRDVTIAVTQLPAFAPVLRLVFGKCGIPLYLAGTEDVLQSGVISTLIFALEVALQGFAQKDVLRYLRSTLSPLTPEACDKIENYAIVWGISGKRWTEGWTANPRGLKDDWDDADRLELEMLNQDRMLAMEPLVRLRDGFLHATTLGQQVTTLADFLEEIGYAQKLSNLAEKLDGEGDNRSAQILNQLWELLLNALEQLYDVLGETVWDAEAFVALFKLLLSQCQVGTIPPVLDAVSVGTVSAMRCQSQKKLIVLGADEGSLPGYAGSEGLLSDMERVALRRCGVPLTGGAIDGLQAEFADIYGLFCGAREEITVISSAQQASFLFRRIGDMSGGIEQVEQPMTTPLRQQLAAGSFLARHHAWDQAAACGVEEAMAFLNGRVHHDLGEISLENIQKLYGKKLYLSASQVDRQAECRLSYFLKYGLRTQERKEATVDPAEFGTYVHFVLEQTAREVMNRGGFHHVTLEDTLAIAKERSSAYVSQRFADLESSRLEYLFQRNMQELELVVRELWRELREAAYIPSRFELRFGLDGELPAITIDGNQMNAVLQGLVDRVDIWPRGDSTYFRVVDYKTGKKEMDYCDIFNGVGLQMLLYLFALERAGGAVIPGMRVGAGVQYFPARVPYVPVDHALSKEEAEQKRLASWKRSGLLLLDEDSLRAMDASEKLETLSCKVLRDGSISGDVADRQQMGLLQEYLMKWLSRMVDDIASGNVTPNPYTRGNKHNACTYCPYGQVCHQSSVPGRRNYEAMTAKAFWQAVEEEVETNG